MESMVKLIFEWFHRRPTVRVAGEGKAGSGRGWLLRRRETEGDRFPSVVAAGRQPSGLATAGGRRSGLAPAACSRRRWYMARRRSGEPRRGAAAREVEGRDRGGAGIGCGKARGSRAPVDRRRQNRAAPVSSAGGELGEIPVTISTWDERENIGKEANTSGWNSSSGELKLGCDDSGRTNQYGFREMEEEFLATPMIEMKTTLVMSVDWGAVGGGGAGMD
uniref:Uncharacterized protein n=1 Tax=Oryza brachyantha TaxID=4533 RepID=J3M514_ORYBR